MESYTILVKILDHLHIADAIDAEFQLKSYLHQERVHCHPEPWIMQRLSRSWCAFQVLRNYGPKGRSVGKIVEEMSKKGLREFSSARNAKSSVASTCAHDTAFARVAPGTFALRAVPGVVEVQLLSSRNNWPVCCYSPSGSSFSSRLQKIVPPRQGLKRCRMVGSTGWHIGQRELKLKACKAQQVLPFDWHLYIMLPMASVDFFLSETNCSVGLTLQVPPSTPGTKSTPAEREEEEEPEEPVIKPAPRFAKFDRNNFKCTRCLKVDHCFLGERPCHVKPPAPAC